MAPLADLLDEFRHAMGSSGELQSRRREQARRSVHPQSLEGHVRERHASTSLTRPAGEPGRTPLAGHHCARCGHERCCDHPPACTAGGHPTLTKGNPGGYPGATQGLPRARGVHVGRACGACVCPQVWEHASVEVLERLAGMPEVQDIVERLGARAAAGEISVGQAGSATADHLLKLAMPPPASGMSEPSCK